LTDIVLGTLIGVGGTVLGSIVVGVINHISLKLQINARRDELIQQQTYNEQQARIERLIKLREPVLIPLRKVVSRWLQLQNKSSLMTKRLVAAYAEKDNPKERASERKLWEESGEEATQITTELATLQGQLGDSSLAQMIDTVVEAYWENLQEITKLQITIVNQKDSVTNSLELIKEYRSSLNKLRGYLVTVMKRIDDLLIGEPSD